MGVKRRVLISFLAFIILLFSNSLVYSQWTSVPPIAVSTSWWVGGVHFTSPSEGWAVGGDDSNHIGVLLHYSGGTWTSVPPPSVSSDWMLGGVYFTSSSEGWAEGTDNSNQRGVLLHYSGGTWTSVPPPSVSTNWVLEGVHFTSPGEGWAVGIDDTIVGGTLLHYSGSTWTLVPPPSVSTNWVLWGVHFTSPGEGWAVGGDHSNHIGVLLHYSGDTWTSVPPPSVSTDWELYGVYFTSSDEGWAVGFDNINHTGVLLHYSGSTWTSVPPPAVSTSWFLGGVYLTSPSEGWAVGADDSNHVGVLLHFGYVISPMAGTIGTEITITSSGFGTRKGKVFIATTSLKILDWSDGLIRCLLSKALPPDTYGLTIRPQIKGSSPIIIENAFIVKAPEILSVDPSHGAQGAGSTIRGNFFGTKKGKVTLGGKNCKVLRWTMDPTTGVSEIDFVVPKRLTPGLNELKIINGVGSDTVDFTVE